MGMVWDCKTIAQQDGRPKMADIRFRKLHNIESDDSQIEI